MRRQTLSSASRSSALTVLSYVRLGCPSKSSPSQLPRPIRRLRQPLQRGFGAFRPAPVHGRGVGARQRFTGGSVRSGLATSVGLRRLTGMDAPRTGWSDHSNLIFGGLKRVRRSAGTCPRPRVRGRSTAFARPQVLRAPERRRRSGDGSCRASVLAASQYHARAERPSWPLRSIMRFVHTHENRCERASFRTARSWFETLRVSSYRGNSVPS